MAEMMRNDQTSPDIQTELLLSFSEAAKECTKDLCFDAFVPCDSCDGCGYPPNAKVKVCPIYRGKGTVTIPPFTSTCNTCNRLGRIIKEYYISCQGSGVVEGVKEVKVTIPASVDYGDTIRIPEAGNIKRQGNQPSNLFIRIKMQFLLLPCIFKKRITESRLCATVDSFLAILGGEVEVPTLSGKVQVKDCQSMVFYYIIEISMSASALICQRMFRIALYQISIYAVTYQVIMLGTRTTYISERFSLALNLKYGYCVLFLQIGNFGLSKNAYCTSEFYTAERMKYMQQSDVPDYLKHLEMRLHEENERCLLYMDAITRKPLIATGEGTPQRIHE
ncbi:chaperone protein dnaJ 1 [Hibiscus syriacus]|uniref:Chaperone protein dnaJ 1 n=1 Tax=Hibiscus syriacus TaxID=106335 RepID=A0A6A3AHE7_HIBSY|nr:chaperone protein dnaJ 1 [Hibiscus syriacus]